MEGYGQECFLAKDDAGNEDAGNEEAAESGAKDDASNDGARADAGKDGAAEEADEEETDEEDPVPWGLAPPWVAGSQTGRDGGRHVPTVEGN